MEDICSNLSIVVQGPIIKKVAGNIFSTKDVVEKLRVIFPKSEIILSTWKYEDTENIKCDKILRTIDPGAMLFEEGSRKTNNINRMLISSRAGIKESTRKYLLKIRSDMMPTDSNFIKLWENLSREPKKFALFSKKILAYPIYSMKYETDGKNCMPKPFHLSDWAFFGLSKDIDYLFSIPLPEEPKFSTYFIKNENKNYDTIPNIKWQYSPEQYLMYKAFSKKYFVKFENKRDYNKRNIYQSKIAILENFLFIDPEMWGLIHGKEFYNRPIYEYDSRCYFGLYRFIDCVLYMSKKLDFSYLRYLFPEYIKHINEVKSHKKYHNI